MKEKIVVIGAGISGLSTAYWLHKEGYKVTVLDKNREPGGVMESVFQENYLFDRGPNSGLETSPLVARLVRELDLHDQFIYANEKGNKRYILRNNKLQPLPMNPMAFITTELFSAKAKLRLFAEPFIGKSSDGYYQSIAEFVKRRLGQEFLDYAINPFVAGVYAGNPEELSVKSAFPKLYALEEKYGGLIKGTVKSIKERKQRSEQSKQSAKMFSFKNGMQTLPAKIADALGENVQLFSEVKSVEKTGDGYLVTYNHTNEIKTITANAVISAIPAYAAAEIFKPMGDEELIKHFSEVYYPPVAVLYVVYNRQAVKQPLDGFGFLIPAKEKKSFLGAIWSSVLFPNRAEEDKASFTIFIGGARDPGIANIDKEWLFEKVLKEFQEIMKIEAPPVSRTYRYWQKAIPQYNIGYIEHENYFDDFEKRNPGIVISGNFRGGISVGDCIKNSESSALKITEYLES